MVIKFNVAVNYKQHTNTDLLHYTRKTICIKGHNLCGIVRADDCVNMLLYTVESTIKI